ncbi:hypothetical protein J4423_04720 [Candidatus Pacearchaeota archaeon]|nr:hypothetical protein [Candidatus Pacearchaeota archaeon]
MDKKDPVRQVQEEIVVGISEDGRPPESIRSLYDLSRHVPKDTPADQFARAVDGLVQEGVTPMRQTPISKGYYFEPTRARGKYL